MKEKAIDFEFNNRRLSEFGCILCNFGDSKGLETVTDSIPISFSTVPTMNGSKHNLTFGQYDDCLQTTLQICKFSCDGDVQEINAVEHRKLTAWLCRKEFLKFKFLDEDNIELYHEAKIDVSRIEIDGRLYGLELEVTTNRPFALKEPQTIIVDCKEGQKVYAWEKRNATSKLGYVTSKDENAYSKESSIQQEDGYWYTFIGQVYKTSINDTSYEEGYIYPQVEITVKEDGDLKIYNAIEDRETYIGKCKSGEVITMDYPVIRSSDSSHNINIQNDFNWVFFRVANTFENSRNDLIIFLPCKIKIKYSPIVKVGL